MTWTSSRWTYVILSVLVPLWLIFGRIPFNAAGWMMVILLLAAPLLAIVLLLLSLTFAFRVDVRRSGQLNPADIRPLSWLFGSLALAGIFLVDFGDAEGSTRSIFSVLMGNHLLSLSAVLEVACFGLAAGALVWTIVWLIRSYIQPNRRRPANSNE